jgi:Zn-dependent protease/predicted transcriptional regulator
MKPEEAVKAQIKLGRVFGIELGLHFSWIVIAVLITFSLAEQFNHTNPEWGAVTVWATAVITGILFFACLFAHELSHAFVARLRGLPIRKITLFFLGGVAQIEKEASDPKTEFWMGIAGPIMSAVVGLICLALAYAAGWHSGVSPQAPITAVLLWLGYINLMLAAFNMIPGFPLDGGRVLRAIIWWINRNEVRATRIAATVGQIVATLFIVWGIWRFFTGAGLGGLWLGFIGWFLLQASGASTMQVEASAVLRKLRVSDLMTRDCEQVNGNLDLQTFVSDYMLRTGRRCFIVMQDGHMAGMITPNEVRQVDRPLWPSTTIASAMRPLDSIHSVGPDTPASDALDIMTREDVNQVPVVSNGWFQGVVSRGNILRVLQTAADLNRKAA